jgi:hypothetical protein
MTPEEAAQQVIPALDKIGAAADALRVSLVELEAVIEALDAKARDELIAMIKIHMGPLRDRILHLMTS